MKPWDETIYETVAVKRSAFFRPLAAMLSRLGITPDMMSYLGLVLAALFIYVIGKNITASFWILIGMLLCDQLDGAIARYHKTASERGKFVDVAIDSSTFVLIVIGLAHAGLIGAATAVAYVYFATLQRVLAIVIKNFDRPNQSWLFYAGAGPLPSTFIYLTYFIFGVAVIGGHDYLQISSLVFVAILAAKAAADFWTIRYKA